MPRWASFQGRPCPTLFTKRCSARSLRPLSLNTPTRFLTRPRCRTCSKCLRIVASNIAACSPAKHKTSWDRWPLESSVWRKAAALRVICSHAAMRHGASGMLKRVSMFDQSPHWLRLGGISESSQEFRITPENGISSDTGSLTVSFSLTTSHS